MIDIAVKHVVSELNLYLDRRALGMTPGRVIAGSMFDLDGNLDDSGRDKVIASLVNVEQDRVYRSIDPFDRADDGTVQFVRPEVNVNLYVLFIANLSNYDEAMKAISHIIAFFQRHNVFSISDPSWDPIEEAKVSFELFTLSFEQQNDLWGAIGAKSRPSVMYKAGLLRIRDTQVEADIGRVEEIRIGG